MNSSSRRSRGPPFVTTITPDFVPAGRIRRCGRCAACAPLRLAGAGAAGGCAQGRLDAQYEATLAGIPVGKGAWTIEIGDDTFSAAASGGTSGLLKAFSGGTGTGASQGRVVNGALVATAYTATTTTSKKSETIRMVLANGSVKEFSIEPEPPVDPDRIVGHRRASPRRARSDDGLDAAGARHWRSAVAGGLPHRRRRSSTAACATTSSSITSAWKP